MKKFLIVGTDGLYTTAEYDEAESAIDVRIQILLHAASLHGDGGDINPTSYTIYEVTGKPVEITQEEMESAAEVREKLQREHYGKQQADSERRQYELLKKKFGDK